jgi:uncharacterized protein YxjI
MPLQNHSSFLLAQRITVLVNRYEYYTYDNALRGACVAFAEQKRFTFREQITVWGNESRAEVLFTIQAEKVLDVHGKFLVQDSSGALLGYCQKVFGASLLRSTWEVYDANGVLVCIAHEANQGMALFRRALQFVPVVGEFASFVPFNFILEKDGVSVGTHSRVWGTFHDQYALEILPPLAGADRRLFLALGLLLDALQDR